MSAPHPADFCRRAVELAREGSRPIAWSPVSFSPVYSRPSPRRTRLRCLGHGRLAETAPRAQANHPSDHSCQSAARAARPAAPPSRPARPDGVDRRRPGQRGCESSFASLHTELPNRRTWHSRHHLAQGIFERVGAGRPCEDGTSPPVTLGQSSSKRPRPPYGGWDDKPTRPARETGGAPSTPSSTRPNRLETRLWGRRGVPRAPRQWM